MNNLTKFGLVGTVVTAICCFTPLLVWAVAFIGLGSVTVYLDMILLPLLAVFVLVTLWGISTQK